MSSTREEILAALADHPEGLTSKELAPLCPACDCDPQIVGRTIAMLRAENVIHPGAELRDGGAIWIFGKAPAPTQVERITLPEHGRAAPAQVSEAARAIAAMRSGSAGAPRPRAPAAPSQQQPEQAAPQEGASMTIRAKIEAVLRTHGPMTSRAMRKHGLKDDTLGQHLGDLATRKILVRLPGGGPRSTVYALPGQKAVEKTEAPAETTKVERAPKARKAKKVKAARAKAKRAAAPRPRRPHDADRFQVADPNELNGAPQFAINENGELGIEHEGQKMRLDAVAFARLRTFIEKTEPVWTA